MYIYIYIMVSGTEIWFHIVESIKVSVLKKSSLQIFRISLNSSSVLQKILEVVKT